MLNLYVKSIMIKNNYHTCMFLCTYLLDLYYRANINILKTGDN